MDVFIKEKLHVKRYARYMDDFVILICMNFSALPGVFSRIFEEAFGIRQAVAGAYLLFVGRENIRGDNTYILKQRDSIPMAL